MSEQIDTALKSPWQVRRGLPVTKDKLAVSDPLNVLYVGGCQTELGGWRELFTELIEKWFHPIQVNSESLCLGGVDLRGMYDPVLATVQRVKPHLVFLDLATSNIQLCEVVLTPLLEDLVRYLLHDVQADVCFLHCYKDITIDSLENSNCFPPYMMHLESVADYYDIPTINFVWDIFQRHMRQEIFLSRSEYESAKEKLSVDELRKISHFAIDGAHPIPGSANLMYFEVFEQAFPRLIDDAVTGSRRLPKKKTRTLANLSLEEVFSTYPDDATAVCGLAGSKGAIPDLSRFYQLKLLDLSYSRVAELGTALREISTLQELRLLHCGYTGGFPDLSGCTQLQNIQLEGNELKSFLPRLINMNSIRLINCKQNSIEGRCEIPSSSSLAILWLSKNKLTGRLPDVVENPLLQELYINGNRLDGALPRLKCNNLQRFNATSCDFDSYPAGTFLNNSLSWISVRGNRLQPVDIERILADIQESQRVSPRGVGGHLDISHQRGGRSTSAANAMAESLREQGWKVLL